LTASSIDSQAQLLRMFEGKKSKKKEGQVGPIDNYVTAMPA
jgi:hypothetical protein